MGNVEFKVALVIGEIEEDGGTLLESLGRKTTVAKSRCQMGWQTLGV